MNSDTIDNIEQHVRHLTENYGYEPDRVSVYLDSRCMVIGMENFIGSEMKTFINRTDSDALHTTRELIFGYVVPELIEHLKAYGIELASVYYDWDDYNLSGAIFGLRKEHTYKDKEDYYRFKDKVHHQVAKVTYEIEKVPDAIYSLWLTKNVLIIVRLGLLIKIEKAFIRKGFEEVLRITKRDLEKKTFLEQGKIDEVLNRKQRSCYLDWEFNLDRSVLVYFFEDEGSVQKPPS